MVTICTAQWSLYVPPSGHYMYRTVVTICTTSLTFNNSTFCPHSVFMCFVWIWEQTAIISLNSIDWLVCRRVRKIVKTDCYHRHVRLSVCPHTTPLPIDGISWNILTWLFFEHLPRKYKNHWNRTRITRTLHDGQYTFVITSRSVLLIMRNVSDKICRENQNTHFVFHNVFVSTIVPFER